MALLFLKLYSGISMASEPSRMRLHSEFKRIWCVPSIGQHNACSFAPPECKFTSSRHSTDRRLPSFNLEVAHFLKESFLAILWNHPIPPLPSLSMKYHQLSV
ncbi:unnamed protein product [Hymenolepis diminuta]|uniref:Uncharacterized protein n=1 Tax=Hymenolepis diminuta TaxID=6216 RepID=A0A3P6XHN5_HYMDI|nr:unnamed protein product [Hymenolepis diminuta]